MQHPANAKSSNLEVVKEMKTDLTQSSSAKTIVEVNCGLYLLFVLMRALDFQGTFSL